MCGESSKKPKARKKDKYEKLQLERDELFAKLQRVSADYVNYQKRSAKQISEAIAYQKESVIKSFLPVLDNFDHTLNGAEKLDDIKSLRKAIDMIYDQLLSILKTHGVESIESVGEVFDPKYHEAMLQKSDPEKEEMIILEEFQKGYRIGEKALRPGKVIVNKKTSAVDDESDTEEIAEDTDSSDNGDDS